MCAIGMINNDIKNKHHPVIWTGLGNPKLLVNDWTAKLVVYKIAAINPICTSIKFLVYLSDFKILLILLSKTNGAIELFKKKLKKKKSNSN